MLEDFGGGRVELYHTAGGGRVELYHTATHSRKMATFGDSGTLGGNSRLPLPESFDGTMEKWEDWSWHVRSYVSMFKEHVLRVMDSAEEATSVIH